MITAYDGVMPARRFPPPWSVEELAACFVVRDHSGQQLAYVYFAAEPGQRCLRHFRDLMRSPCSRKSALVMGREHKSIQVGVMDIERSRYR
jgi:hypothetical protein